MTTVKQLLTMGAIYLLAGIGNVSLAAEYTDGFEAYRAGDYGEAFRIWKARAEQGNANAQNNLAMLYVNGKGTQRDYQAAVKWFRIAINNNSTLAQTNLGLMYITGRGVERDIPAAYRLWRGVADVNPVAKANLDRLCSEHTWMCHFQSWSASR